MLIHWTRAAGAALMAIALSACGAGGAGGTDASGDTGVNEAGVRLIEPGADVELGAGAPGSVTIAWRDTDPARDDEVALIADRDGDPATTGDQVSIAGGLPDGSGGMRTLQWEVNGTPPGSYRILAMTGPSRRAAVSPGAVYLNEGPSLTVLDPTSDVIVSRGGLLGITYRDTDPDDTALTWFALDRDGDAGTPHDTYPLTQPLPEQNGATQRIVTDIGDTPLGSYRLLGSSWDGTNPVTAVQSPPQVAVQNVALARVSETSSSANGQRVATFPDGSMVVVGYWLGTMSLGDPFGNSSTLTTNVGGSVFFARYDAEGRILWVRSITGPDLNLLLGSVAAFDDGSFALCGSLKGSATIGRALGASGPFITLNAGTNRQIFVVKYDAEGLYRWGRLEPTTWTTTQNVLFPHAYGVAASPDGSLTMTGSFTQDLTLGSGTPGETTLTSSSLALFLARYDGAGSLLWSRKSEGTNSGQLAQGVADAADGSVVICGFFSGPATATMTLGSGEPNQTTLGPGGAGFVARYDGTGSLIRAAAVAHDGGYVSMRSVDAAPDGSFAVAGFVPSSTASATFGVAPGPTITLTNPDGVMMHFCARYHADGTVAWARKMTLSNSFPAVTALPDGSVVFAGAAPSVTIDPGETSELTIGDGGFPSIFLARFRSDGSIAWAREDGGDCAAYAAGVAHFADGSVAVVGMYGSADPLSLGTGDAREFLAPTDSGFEIFVARYNADGGF